MSEQLTHSDLIYLFVDGEASGAERSKLYDALANNPDLQVEFEDALRMKAAIEREVQVAIPPPSLTEALFLRAGVAVPLSATTVVAPAIPAITNAGWFAVAKSVVLPILAVTGAVTYGLVTYSGSNVPTASEPTAVVRMAETPTAPTEQIVKPNTSSVALEEGTIKEPTAQLISRSTTQHSSSNVREALPIIATESENKQIVVNSVDANKAPIEIINNSMSEIPTVTTTALSPMPISDIRNNSEHISPNPLDITGVEKQTKYLSISYEHYSGGSFFQDRNGKVPTTGFMLNNSAVMAALHIDGHNSIVAMVGEESFPFYLKNTSGSFTAQPALTWFGVGYRYMLSAIATPIGAINPVGRLVVAGSTNGGFGGLGVGKGNVGFEYAPANGPINISAGYEVTELLYKSGSALRGAGKGAFTIGAGWSF